MLLAAAGLLMPLLAQAAGLGGLTVLSSLGEPLNADVQIVSLHPGELESLHASLAPRAAYHQAGIQFNPALYGLKFTVERKLGKPIVHVTSAQVVKNPFLDVLIELRWAGGQMVREYTLLLNPPGYTGTQGVAAAPPVVTSKPVQPLVKAESHPLAVAAHKAAAVPKPQAAAAKTYRVKKGDTLSGIALRHLAAGVTLDQMLIAVYRANRPAFIDRNINLVRAGRILNIPSSKAASAINPKEASAVVRTQMQAFAAYRRKLAAAVAARAAPAASHARSAAGKITQKQTKVPPAAKKDRLRLARVEPGHPHSAASQAARSDNRLAQEQALKEAKSRVSALQKNVADLQKLLAMKNEELAELQKRAGVHIAAVAAATSAIVPAAKAASADGSVKQASPVPAASHEAVVPKTSPSASHASAPKATTKPTPAPAAKPKQRARPRVAPPPPPPSLVDIFLGNPLAMAGLGVIIVLLGAYGAWAWRRKKAAQIDSHEALGGVTGEGPSVFGGASVAQQPSILPGLSQLSVSPGDLGPGETEEVDPIAEADVYMAYGRDAQAEEILKEARQKEPNRVAIHAKLLEIYANRHDAKSFEQTALQVRSLTGDGGAEWDKAAKLGRSIDPHNPLYGGPPSDDTLRMNQGAEPATAASPTLDFDLGGTTGESVSPTQPAEKVNPHESTTVLDFDLGSAAPGEEERGDFAGGGTLIMSPEEQKPASTTLDFDLGTPGQRPEAREAKGQVQASKPSGAATPTATAAGGGDGTIDFDFNLDLGETKPAAQQPADSPVDLSSINLDLGAPTGGEAHARSGTDPKWQEVATKLDLAKAYEEMGDKDGARELLNEALKEGDSAQQGQARQMLASLG